jgi:CRISPR-associated protein Csx14
MAEASIPVDLYNPGQVFACLGFLEAADILCGDAEGGFDWSDPARPRFHLRAAGEENPFGVVLAFLAEATPKPWAHQGYGDEPAKKATGGDDDEAADGDTDQKIDTSSPTFVAPKADRMALPIRLVRGDRQSVALGHWADGSSRDDFKLYSGNRSAYGIACAMLKGVRNKPKKTQMIGDIKSKGVEQLWRDDPDALTERPFDILTAMGGSFNLDPRGAWTAIDLGYSLNDQGHVVSSSPVVEILAAWGLEHARPDEFETREVRYAAWEGHLPPELARAALSHGLIGFPSKQFRFTLALSGKNKIVTSANMETPS